LSLPKRERNPPLEKTVYGPGKTTPSTQIYVPPNRLKPQVKIILPKSFKGELKAHRDSGETKRA